MRISVQKIVWKMIVLIGLIIKRIWTEFNSKQILGEWKHKGYYIKFLKSWWILSSIPAFISTIVHVNLDSQLFRRWNNETKYQEENDKWKKQSCGSKTWKVVRAACLQRCISSIPDHVLEAIKEMRDCDIFPARINGLSFPTMFSLGSHFN